MEVGLADKQAAEELSTAIDETTAKVAANVPEIPDPSTADAEEVANKVNDLIAALIAAELMES